MTSEPKAPMGVEEAKGAIGALVHKYGDNSDYEAWQDLLAALAQPKEGEGGQAVNAGLDRSGAGDAPSSGGFQVHVLKTWPGPFAAVRSGAKTWEYRKDDRGFNVGDTLWLDEFDPDTGLTGQNEIRVVTYILRGPAFGVPEGYAVMSMTDNLNDGAARVHAEAAPSNGLNQNPPSWPDNVDWPEGARFTFQDDPGEHDPCYVVMPGGAMLPLNHHAGEGVDVARAHFIINACNAALFPAQPPSLTFSDERAPPNPQEAEGWKPINTAPKDGTHFIGRGPAPAGGDIEARETHWCFYGKGSLSRAAFDRGEGPSGAWRWSEPIHNWSSSWNPTHWRSLDWDVADPADKWPPQGAVDALIHGQRQIDMDGVEIAVSRQALDEVLAFFVPKEPT